jgi:hypothetical protein
MIGMSQVKVNSRSLAWFGGTVALIQTAAALSCPLFVLVFLPVKKFKVHHVLLTFLKLKKQSKSLFKEVYEVTQHLFQKKRYHFKISMGI